MAQKKPRFGKDDSIFSFTEEAPKKTSTTGRGRPKKHADEWSKITTVVFDRQIVFLDSLALKIRRKTGNVIRRAEILRALIDVLEESKIDLRDVENADDLKARLLAAMK